MGVSRFAALAAALLVATSLVGCASTNDGTLRVHLDRDGSEFSLGKSEIPPAEWRDMEAQIGAEKRRRLDALVATYPDDLPVRFDRLLMAYSSYAMEFKSSDEATILTDSEILLDSPTLSGRSRLPVLEWRAETLTRMNRLAEAIVVADQALAIDGSDARALITRGWAQYLGDEKQADGALADLDHALQLEPDQAVGLYRRGAVLRLQGRLDRAAADFKHALLLAPDNFDAHYMYGLFLLDMKEPVHALAQFDAAVSLMPLSPAVWAWRGQANVWLHHYDDARADAEHAIGLGASGETLAAARGALAAALNDQMDFGGAAREYRAALAIEDDLNSRRGLMRSLWYAGDFRQAAELFHQLGNPPTTDEYTPLWLFLMRGRADPRDEGAAKAELAASAPPHQPHGWSDTLVDLMLGRMTLEVALAEADASATYQLKAGRRCEVDYYAAEQLLMRGQDEGANRLLEEAYWVCPSTYYEAKAVVGERRLQEAKLSRH